MRGVDLETGRALYNIDNIAVDTPPDAASRYRRPGTTLYVFALPASVVEAVAR